MAIDKNTVYGVTPQGFVRMRLPEIKENLALRLEDKLGCKVSREPNSVIDILLSLIASESDRQWQLAEADYYARSPVTADEGSLDNTLAYSNVIRKKAERTVAYVTCYGDNGVDIGDNAQVQDNNGNKYNIDNGKLNLNHSITSEYFTYAEIRIKNIDVGLEFYIILDGNKIATTVLSDDNPERIMQRIISLLPDEYSGEIDAYLLKIRKKGKRYGGKIFVCEFGEILDVGSPVRFIAEKYGPINPRSIRTINTNVAGWKSVVNEDDCIVGRNSETTSELRNRYASSVFSRSVGMKESLQSSLLAIPNVKTVTVYENKTNVKADGIKPHSFEVVIDGGDDLEISKTIANKTPLGIDSSGDVSHSYYNEDTGYMEYVCFSRPHSIDVEFMVTVYEYKEEKLSDKIINSIKGKILSECNRLQVGDDVIAQRFIGPIYRESDGLGYIDLKVAKVSDGIYTDKSIPMGKKEKANTTYDKITVVMGVEENAKL